MASWRAFVVSGARLTVHHRRGSKLLDPFSFEADEEGLARFTRYLERFPNDVTCLLADVVEDFREETIPHVLAWDRRALLRARAARAFPDARYVHSTRLGREPEGRRDDRVLFSGITRPEVLAPWLAPMARHAAPLAGISSPAMLTGPMLKAIGAGGGHVLVVSIQSGGGLRQTCFRRGRLRLSRLAAMPDLAPGGHGSHVLAEVERTRRYLGSLHAAADEGRLEVHVLSHGGPLEELRRELRREAGDDVRGECTLVDLAAVARKLGMRRWGGEPTADRLFVHVLAKRRAPPNHYATPGETRHFSMLQARSFLKAASAGLVAGGCLFGGVTFLEGVIAGGHARTLALQSMLYEHRYREARAELPLAPAEPADLERVVSAAGALRSRRADPVDLLELVSHALAGFPRVRIDSLSWRAGADAEAPSDDGVGGEDGHRPAPPAGEEPRRDPKVLFQIALVGARIEPFDGDHRAALDTIRGFAGTLAASPGVEHVEVVKFPLDLSPERTLSGDAGTPAGAAEFEIRVMLRGAVPDGAEE